MKTKAEGVKLWRVIAIGEKLYKEGSTKAYSM